MDEIIGQKIVGVRPLTKAELEAWGWERRGGTALVLENGVVLYASKDPEGNGPGALYYNQGNETYMISAQAA